MTKGLLTEQHLHNMRTMNVAIHLLNQEFQAERGAGGWHVQGFTVSPLAPTCDVLHLALWIASNSDACAMAPGQDALAVERVRQAWPSTMLVETQVNGRLIMHVKLEDLEAYIKTKGE